MGLSLGEALQLATERLTEAGIESARLDARLLLEFTAGCSRADVIGFPERTMSEQDELRLSQLIARRAAHEPVSRILGSRPFWGLSFRLNQHTLDPRPDSETMITALLQMCPDGATGASLSILDIGTGTGCLLLALLSEWPKAQGLGVDISVEALAQAQENAELNGLNGRARWRESNWLEGIDGPFDVVVSNPPYIPTGQIVKLAPEVKDYDPHAALDGGRDGLTFYRKTAAVLHDLLSPKGIAALEVGEGQAAAVIQLFNEPRFLTSTVNDLAGKPRCVLVARR